MPRYISLRFSSFSFFATEKMGFFSKVSWVSPYKTWHQSCQYLLILIVFMCAYTNIYCIYMYIIYTYIYIIYTHKYNCFYKSSYFYFNPSSICNPPATPTPTKHFNLPCLIFTGFLLATSGQYSAVLFENLKSTSIQSVHQMNRLINR